MNKEAYENMNLPPIGANCFYQSISCSLEYLDAVFLAMEYVTFDFIYNRKSFTGFSTEMEPEEYLIPDNKLLFNDLLFSEENPLCQYRYDYEAYIWSLFEKSKVYTRYLHEEQIPEYNLDSLLQANFKEKYLDNNIPLNINMDTFYLIDEYIKSNGKPARRHNGHLINLIDIDMENMTGTIVDKYFGVKGKVSINALNTAMKGLSDFLVEPCITYINPISNEDKKQSIINMLKRNLENLFEESVIINGNKYLKNDTAIKHFINDFPDIVEELEDRFGIYAPQHISYPLIRHRAQRKSVALVFESVREFVNADIMNSIIPSLKKSAELWQCFDQLLDKIYLINVNIKSRKDRLLILLEKLLEIDSDIMKQLKSLYIWLNESCYII